MTLVASSRIPALPKLIPQRGHYDNRTRPVQGVAAADNELPAPNPWWTTRRSEGEMELAGLRTGDLLGAIGPGQLG
jgi:hypothetical protein